MKTIKILVIAAIMILFMLNAERFLPRSSAEHNDVHDTNAQKRSRALWLYANGKGAEAFTILDSALEDPNKMADFTIWLPLYQWTFVDYAEIGDEHFFTDKATAFIKASEDKKDKGDIDFIKIATSKAIGKEGDYFDPSLDDLVKKFPDTPWKEWVEYQRATSKAWTADYDKLRQSMEDGADPGPSTARAEIANYAKEALKKNPNTYLRRMLIWDIRGAAGAQKGKMQDVLETHVRNYGESVKDEEAKKILQSLVAELDKIRDLSQKPSNYALSSDPLLDVCWNMRGAQPSDKKEIAIAFFRQRMSEGAGQNIPDDIKQIILSDKPIEGANPPASGGENPPPSQP